MRSRWAFALSMAGMLLVATGCAGSGGGGPAGSGDTVYEADYPQYASVAELVEAADAVVEGRIVGSNVEELTLPGGPGSADDLTMVYTISDVSVTTVHQGRLTVGDVVRVKQPGGTYRGTRYDADQYPVEVDRTYLLFLAVYDDAPASLLNPTQAGYQVAADGSYLGGPGNTLRVDRRTLGSRSG